MHYERITCTKYIPGVNPPLPPVHISVFRCFILQIVIAKRNTDRFFPGGHERRTDDVRHYQVPEAKQYVRRGSGQSVRISSHVP